MILMSMLRTILEADEIDMRKIGPEKTEVIMITSGFNPSLAELKSKIFKLFGVPMKIMNVKEVELMQKGILTKRYRVTGVIESGVEKMKKGLLKNLRDRDLGMR